MVWVMQGEYVEGRSEGLTLRRQKFLMGGWLELMRDILTVFALTVGLRINHGRMRTKADTVYCAVLAKRSGPAGRQLWGGHGVLCVLSF